VPTAPDEPGPLPKGPTGAPAPTLAKVVLLTADPRSAQLLAGLLAAAAAAHFAHPRLFDPLVPQGLPGDARAWTYGSGVAELAVAAAVALPRSRRAGALAATGLFVAVFPANVKMALDWRARPAPFKAAAYARLPLQVPLVWWAARVARAARRESATSDAVKLAKRVNR
jgi:uncharacterized membrane protein